MIYLLTTIGLSPSGSITVHIYTQTIHRTTQTTTNLGTVRAVPRLCEFYLGICLTTEEKARKNLSQDKKTSLRVQYTYYQHTNTLQNLHTYTHTHTHTLQNNIKPPQYKLKQTQCKIYPNEIVTINTLTISSP